MWLLHQNGFLEQDLKSTWPPAMNVSDPPNATITPDPLGGHSIWEVILIVLTTGTLSLVTIIGNLMVLVAFKVNSDLKTVNNYFLLSLACADLIIGVLSMNLYTTYIIMGYWPLGSISCDLWLALDYVASNASVMNLLIISFDRYFSITRPLTYRAKRTPKRAAIMISMAWTISFVLWAPAILFWQYIVGERTVGPGKCYIQFLSEPTITFGTAIAAFYLPVTIMCILYWRIYRETENRTKELAALTGSETTNIVQPAMNSFRSTSSSDQSQAVEVPAPTLQRPRVCCFPKWKQPILAQKSQQENSSNGSWNNTEEGGSADSLTSSEGEDQPFEMKSICSVVIKLPMINSVVRSPNSAATEGSNETLDKECPRSARGALTNSSNNTGRNNTSDVQKGTPPKANDVKANKRPTKQKALTLNSTAIKEKMVQKTQTPTTKNQINKRKSISLIKEKKAAKTLSAILLAFILTWTPYNIMVLVSTFCGEDFVPTSLWELGYWLCYVNSTINPMCYALCNTSFRNTFKMLLLCHWDKRKWKTHKRSASCYRTPAH
ncbi:muscarinic acetylcholine receptor M1-like [Ambystoma mexicanum]|uniref:muscarinic acetylcholine receptor M1-like n=1 Tax=Ambystoma mexicanum TaxID=8296 RepID=UPI0037E8EDDC